MCDVIVNIIGTAQDAGIPHPNCFCKNCMRAIEDRKYRRFAAFFSDYSTSFKGVAFDRCYP
ncbi:hypothetical protein [Heyndrickxia oleronia]|uniref:hypothetical protein n=1 Tax=Heyndrickxia oleronia TaxID=38875 RepID=UPI0021B218E5|nr:hypothetical protein [Heyndrickxia oleronia]